MDHVLPHSLNSDSPPHSLFHHHPYFNSSLYPDAPLFYPSMIPDHLIPHVSLIHPPTSPQPIPILHVALHSSTPIQWNARVIPTRMDMNDPPSPEWEPNPQQEVPPTSPPSPTGPTDCPRHIWPRRRRSTRRVFATPSSPAPQARKNMANGDVALPFPIVNFLTGEEMMSSVDLHLNKLVITRFSESLRTLAASIISCLG